MSNTSNSHTAKTAIEKLQEMQLIFGDIQQSTERLLQLAQKNKWNEFQILLQSRQKLIDQFETIRSEFTNLIGGQNGSDTEELRAIQKIFNEHLKKVTKVNNKIYDSINEKKKRLIDNIVNINNGLEFLKSYEKKVNRKKIISKIY